MIFLNNHVIGTSWLCTRGCGHKILPTLYILRGKQADGAIKSQKDNRLSHSRGKSGQHRAG